MDSHGSARRLDHLTLLEDAVQRFASALDAAPLTGRISERSRWTAEDVGAHLGGVHRWAASVVTTGTRSPRTNRPTLSVPVSQWYRESAGYLLAVLAAADADASCWTLDRQDRRVRFWHRRQLHETLVHLHDVRSARGEDAGGLSDVPAEICADGVDEWLQVWPARMSPAAKTLLPGDLLLEAEDAGRRWLLQRDWSFRELRDGERADAHAVVTAAAADLLLWIWQRTGPDVTVAGEGGVVAAFHLAPCHP